MNSVQNKPSRRRATPKCRRTTGILLSFLSFLAALEISQCFVPSALRTTPPRADVIPIVQLRQQLVQIEPNKNEGGEIEIEKTVLNSNSNSTESFGTLFPRVSSSLKLSKTMIESTVDDMLKSTTRTGASMGLFGETMIQSEEEYNYFPHIQSSSKNRIDERRRQNKTIFLK